ncbi:hypothetical protein XU18_0217 [Perkinsela sp. CCAP 1560/4]|nr:hypothetical protein XU18_0217 [Perkinsela sp. CCAP 1560/4]|eukprot:KNH09532.1 hypothetical protein XU18_0217 [Perkinsela sp. CCAP 1560/4]
MKNRIMQAFEERNIDLIAQCLMSPETQSKTNSQFSVPSNSLASIASRFLSLSTMGNEQCSQRKVVFGLLSQSLSSPVHLKEAPFAFGSSIAVSVLRLLCQAVDSYPTRRESKLFLDIALCFLRCLAGCTQFTGKVQSIHEIMTAYSFEDLKTILNQIDYNGLYQLRELAQPFARFTIDQTAELQNRHFAPFFALRASMNKWEVYQCLREVNLTLTRTGKHPIFLSYVDYATLLCIEPIQSTQVFNIFQDLKEESEATERNILLKKEGALQMPSKNEIPSVGIEEHTNRQTWGCIFSQHLVSFLIERLPAVFQLSGLDTSTGDDLHCKACGNTLMPMASAGLLTPAVMERMMGALLSEVTPLQSEDFELYRSSLSVSSQELYIIDGLNVAYYARSRWSKSPVAEEFPRQAPRLSQIEEVVKILQRKGVPNSAIKVILPRKHCIFENERSDDLHLIERWKIQDILVQSPDTISDDICWLAYALTHFTHRHPHFIGRTFLLTNDQMRDHQTRIWNGTDAKTFALFKQWKSLTQIFFDLLIEEAEERTTVSVRLHFPPSIIHGIQCSTDAQTWHIPFYPSEKKSAIIYANHNQSVKDDRSIRWVCAKNIQNSELSEPTKIECIR